MSDELEGLRERALAGDQEAMTDLLRELQPFVLRRCVRLLPYKADAEEAAQDTLLSVARKLDTYTGQAPFLSWVSVIASNAARSTYRSLKRRGVEFGADPVLATQADPRTTSVIAGTRLDLLEALEALEAEHPALLEAVVLRELGGLSYDEVAEQTNQPLGTVKANIHRGRQFLREQLVLRLE